MKKIRITTANYFKAVQDIGFENLPLVLKQSHTVIMTKTDNGKVWSSYRKDADLKRLTELAFKKLEEFIEAKNGLSGIADDQPALAFVSRFLELEHKTSFKEDIESFLNELQKAIKTGSISRSSRGAKEIEFIQQALVEMVNTMPDHINIRLKDTTRKRLNALLKPVPKKKKDGLGEVPETTVEQEPAAVNGNIMSSVEFADMHFDSIGLQGRWKDLIGDPAPGFTAMVFGKPKMGKSYLCVDFAGYLARNHGKVLYVAKEEKLDATLQKKLKDKDVAHPNLFVSDYLPEDLSAYAFIFLDSVNKLGLSPQDLENLKTANPGKAFVFIFQTTKEGNFRGANEFQHDVDIVIEVPEKGKAVQFGRFNQGGEMDIFPENQADSLEDDLRVEDEGLMLAGVNKKPMRKKNSIAKTGKELKVRIAHNSWGDVAVLKHGSDWTAILQPEDIENIAGLKSGESCVVKEEKGYSWTITNNGDGFNIKSQFGNKTGHFQLDTKYLLSNEKWTTPQHLSKQDHLDLKEVNRLYRANKLEEAMKYASRLDTIVRDEIPLEMWKEMGGKLTASGEAKLQKNKAAAQTDILKKFDDRVDDLNPRYMFSSIASQLLSEALNGKFDMMYLVRRELANRGQDEDGKWVGFPKAKEIHKI